MKLFVVFMAMFMLATGFNLCSAEDICDETKQITLSDSADDKHESEGLCSPFCQCSRCPFSIDLPARMMAGSLTASMVNKFTYKPAGVPCRISASIWQPPQYTC